MKIYILMFAILSALFYFIQKVEGLSQNNLKKRYYKVQNEPISEDNDLSLHSDWNNRYLKISSSKHFLEHDDGTDFFLMGDTAYHIPSLDANEVVMYMKNRARKKFNTILVTADNFLLPNYEGESAFLGKKPYKAFRPNDNYWDHIDYIVDKAEEYNLFVVLFSAWGSRLNKNVWSDPYNHVYSYGRFLGNRYKDRLNLIYCAAGEFETIMGDYIPLTDSIKLEWIRRIGKGIRETANPKQLITIHGNPGKPGEKKIPSDFFHHDSWLDFFGNQSSLQPKYIDDQIFNDFTLKNPIKPTINLEPGYEDGFSNWSEACSNSGTPWGQRFQAYWSVFFGGFGHVYGHNRLASMSGPSKNPWKDRNKGLLDPVALNDTGGNQMQYLKKLIESKPISRRIPDNLHDSIIASSRGSDTGDSPNLIVATLGLEKDWAFVYLTKGGSVTVDMSKISGSKSNAQWYNPKNGEYTYIGNFSNSGMKTFKSSTSGENNDWVLVLEKF